MSPAGIRRVKITAWVILIVFLGLGVIWWAISWVVIGLALWGAGYLGLRLGERMRAIGRGGDA
jgi:hypothetical protein